jgi:ABC-type transporter Mla maintaining outer membrane lipid asymmetry ATPase subunit MlaF
MSNTNNDDDAYNKLLKWQKKCFDDIYIDIELIASRKKSNNIGTFIVGPPGSGKSYTIDYMFKKLKKQFPNLNFAKTATTGAAASRLEDAKTLASWFQIGEDAMKLDKREPMEKECRKNKTIYFMVN